jgi:PAS domain-containing protein
MPVATRSLSARYAVSIVAIALGVVLRMWFAPALEDRAPYVFLNIAVIVSAWWGGLGPGLLATAVGAILGAYFFIPDVFVQTKDLLNCGMFALVGVCISLFINALHAARVQAEREAESAQRNWLSLCQSDERARLLAERAAQWRRLYEDRLATGVQAAFSWSPQADRFEIASTWTNLLGTTIAPLPRDLDDWGQIVRADESEDFRNELRKVVQTRQPSQREFRAVRKDGELLGIHLRAFPVVDDTGDVCRVVGLITAMPRAVDSELDVASISASNGQ